jgi:RNA polymerase sigma factor (sigma-70 family)
MNAAQRDEMIVSNLGLVHHIARRLKRPSGMAYEDLAQEGAIGLIRAVDRFDPTLGFALSTYAHSWIYRACIAAIDDHAAAQGDTLPTDITADDDPAAEACVLVDADRLVALLPTLTEREHVAVVLRYGLDGGEPVTLDALGRHLGITRQSAHALLRRALGRLRAA